jgi:hypothetical protein
MIELAQKKVANGRFLKRSILELDSDPGRFDWVVASGLFYLRQHQAYEFMRQAVRSMFSAAKQGVAFNTLADWGSGAIGDGEFRARPDAVIALCREFTPYLALRADYHPCDITLYLYKKASSA